MSIRRGTPKRDSGKRPSASSRTTGGSSRSSGGSSRPSSGSSRTSGGSSRTSGGSSRTSGGSSRTSGGTSRTPDSSRTAGASRGSAKKGGVGSVRGDRRDRPDRSPEAEKRERFSRQSRPSSSTRSNSADSRKRSKPAPSSKTSKVTRPQVEEAIRLNRAIADAGVASRRSADDLIRTGKVRINGMVVTDLATKITLDDFVTVNGEPISRDKHLTYVVLNKPKDCITTASDEKGRTTVFDIVRIKQRLFTVGRLDRNTTGVLLLTNDGELAHRLMHPRYGIPRVYKAVLDKPIRADDARKIAAGIELEDGPTQPADVILDPEDRYAVLLQIREGRNREVRRIFEALGYEVKRLDRRQYGTISTRGLNRGEYRHLTRDEVAELQALVELT